MPRVDSVALLLFAVGTSLVLNDAVLCDEAPPKQQEESSDIRYQQVQSILSDACYTCHGPDDGQREAETAIGSASVRRF